MKRRPTAADVQAEIATLDALELADLQSRWKELFGVPSPFKVRAGFLRYAIAYKLQEQLYGGLSASTKRLLRKVAKDGRELRGSRSRARRDATLAEATPRFRPGDQLVREWNGQLETVVATENGFVWRDKTYGTLTAVALAMTGTKWSGPRFFGLRDTPAPKRSRSAQPRAHSPKDDEWSVNG